MNCKSINKLIYLKREELTEKEVKKLDNHLEVCKSCRLERDEFEKTAAIVSELNKVEPIISDPDLLEDDILKAIEPVGTVDRESIFIRLTDKFSEFFSAVSVRFAMITLLIMIIGFYFFEESSVVINISKLEESSAKNFNQKVLTSGIFEDQVKSLNAIPELYKLISGTKNFAMLSDEWVVMNKTELRSVLQLYRNLNSIKSELPANFKNEYPLLKKFLGRDLDENNIDELLNQKNEIQNEMNKFMDKGGIKNEIKK